MRQQASQLRAELASKGAPLSDEQIKPLQRTLAESHQRSMEQWSGAGARGRVAFAATASATPVSPLEYQEEFLRRQMQENERLRTELAAILTPEQLKHFEERQEAQLKLQQAHMRMMRAQAEAEARGEIAPAPAYGYPGVLSIPVQ